MIDLCMPVYKAVEFECMVGLFSCQWPKGGVRLIGEKGTSDIVRARNGIRERVLSGGSEFSFWVDADVMVPSDAVVRLMGTMEKYEAMVVTGLVRGRTAPNHIACYLEEGQGYRHAFKEGIPEGKEVHSVDACGAACMLVRNEVFRLGASFDKVESFTEDLSFCRAVKFVARGINNNWPIYANSAVRCGHLAETMLEV